MFVGAAGVNGPAAASGAGEGAVVDGTPAIVASTMDTSAGACSASGAASVNATSSNRFARSLPFAMVRSRANRKASWHSASLGASGRSAYSCIKWSCISRFRYCSIESQPSSTC